MIFALYITGRAEQIVSIAIKNPGLNESRNPEEFHIITGNDKHVWGILQSIAPGRAQAIIRNTETHGKYKSLLPVDPTKPASHCQEHYGVCLVTL